MPRNGRTNTLVKVSCQRHRRQARQPREDAFETRQGNGVAIAVARARDPRANECFGPAQGLL
jgi:hypothetical protein